MPTGDAGVSPAVETAEQPRPLVMMNPPYGERLAQDKNVLQLYQAIGTTLKHQFAGATAWIISSNEDALKCIGLKPSRKVHLLNGELDCLFCSYDLFSGTHKDFKTLHPSNDRKSESKSFSTKRPFNAKGGASSRPHHSVKSHGGAASEPHHGGIAKGGAVSRPHPKRQQH